MFFPIGVQDKAWSYNKKKKTKAKAFKTANYEVPKDKRCLLTLEFKPFRSSVKDYPEEI